MFTSEIIINLNKLAVNNGLLLLLIHIFLSVYIVQTTLLNTKQYYRHCMQFKHGTIHIRIFDFNNCLSVNLRST